MNSNEVQVIMDFNGHWHTNGVVRGWNDFLDQSPDSPWAGYAAAYIVPTFFLTVTYEFVFDETGKVVGKHRYD